MINYSEKFEKMKIAGNLASRTLDMLTDNIKPGITTDYIDKLGYEFIRDNGGYSAPLFYRGFKKSLCTSLNHIVCHGIPSSRTLDEGDVVNVDVTAIINNHYGDTSRMFCIGKTSIKVNNLIDATYNSMTEAIKILKPGLKIGDIGYTIQSFVEKKGFSVVRDFCGHGISTTFHEAPNILHYGKKNTDIIEL
jgi:methionyl aminopeptidase